MSAADDLAGKVYDLLADAPEGLTMEDIAEQLSMPRDAIRRAVRAARMTLSDADTLFILAEPQGARQPWRYRLVDGGTLVDFEDSAWVPNRVKDSQSRVALLAAAMAVAVRATDGRSIEGRKARTMERQLRHLTEDLEGIDLEQNPQLRFEETAKA